MWSYLKTKTSKRPGQQRESAQILVMTLILLIIISLTVVSITGITLRNSGLVSNNLRYEQSYSNTETFLLDVIPLLSDVSLELVQLPAEIAEKFNCDSSDSDRIMCSGQTTPTLREVLIIEDTNEIKEVVLSENDYLDIILDEGDNSYDGGLQINWKNDVAIELNLIFIDSAGRYQMEKEIIDGANVLQQNNAGLFNTPPLRTGRSVEIDLGNLNSSRVPNDATIKYLRISNLSRTSGTTVNVTPIDSLASFPNQLRQISGFSYDPEIAEGSTPIVFTQLPLSPNVPMPLLRGGTLNAINTPYCGDGIVQAGEECDNGIAGNDGDGCDANCRRSVLRPNLTIEARCSGSNSRIRLNYSAGSAPTGYDIRFCTGGSCTPNSTLANNTSSTSRNHNNRNPGTTYRYRVRARMGDVVGEWSQIRTARARSCAPVCLERGNACCIQNTNPAICDAQGCGPQGSVCSFDDAFCNPAVDGKRRCSAGHPANTNCCRRWSD